MRTSYRRFFDGPYADFWKEQARRYGHDAGHQRLIDLVASLVPPGGLLIDCGMGNGFPFTIGWSRTQRVAGTDLSERALRMACADLSGGAASRLAAGDLTALPFRTGCADVAVSARSLNYVPDFPKALEELWRITRPGGWLVFDCFNRDHPQRRRQRRSLLMRTPWRLLVPAPGQQHSASLADSKSWLEGRRASVALYDDQGFPLSGEPGATVWFAARKP